MSPESPAPPEEVTGHGFPRAAQIARFWIELAGVWALAIAWPIFQRLQSGSEALTFYGVRGLDLLLFVVLVTLVAPTLLLLVELALGRFASKKWALGFHATMLGALFGLVVWQVIQNLDLPALIIWFGLIAGIALLYVRLEVARTFALLMGLALPVVVGLFLFSYPFRYEVLPGEKAMAAQSTEGDTPVVMIVLDELPLALMLNDHGDLDRRLVPEAARLAKQTTWYPRTFAVADETLAALPTIMTGETPVPGDEPPPPGLPSHPDNVCSIASGAGYRVHAQQIVTDLCGRKTAAGTRIADLLRIGIGQSDSLTPGHLLEDRIGDLAGRYPSPPAVWGIERPGYAKSFTDGLDLAPRGFNFMHLLLPHVPFQFNPDGTGYANQLLSDKASSFKLQNPDNVPETKKNMQQNLAQTIFTLRLVEAVVAKMKASAAWNKSLFVLTADHGASFKVGQSRRTIQRTNAGWLDRVPLFIKYPYQTRGRIDRRFVSSRDIAPTIFDVLGLRPPPDSEGHSLLDPPAGQPDKVVMVSSSGGAKTFTPAEIERQFREALTLRNDAFGSGSLYAIGGHADALGKRPKGLERLDTDYQTQGPDLEVTSLEFFTPNYFQARFPTENSDPGALGIVVNGRIAATTRAWKHHGTWTTAVNLPPSSLHTGTNRLAVVRLD